MIKIARILAFTMLVMPALYAQPDYNITADPAGGMGKCIVARNGKAELWRVQFPNLDDPLPPVKLGESVYVAYSNTIVGLNAATGEVFGYTPLVLEIKALRAVDGILEADIVEGTYDGNFIWYKDTVRWRPGTSAPQYFSNGDLRQARFMQRWASALIRAVRERAGLNHVGIGVGDFIEEGLGPKGAHPAVITAQHKKELTDVIPLVESLEQQDKVNPWYAFELAKLNFLTCGPDAEAWLKKARERLVFGNDAMLMSSEAAEFGNMEWSTGLYDQGRTLRYKEGFVPGMVASSTQLGFEMPLGGPTWYAFSQGKLDEAEMLVQRTYALAPRTAGVSGLYRVMSKKLAEAGRQEAAAAWAVRSEEAKPYAVFGYRPPAWRLLNSTVFIASMLAFIIILGVLIAKHIKRIRLLQKVSPQGDKIPAPVQWWVKMNPFTTASWHETTGIVLTGMVLILSALALASTADTMVRAASMNEAALTGNPGHPEARRWFDRQADCDARHLFLGLHHYVRGEYEQALAEFESAPGSDTARNNKAAVLAKLGRKTDAEAVWKNVGGEGKAAADYNLTGKPADFWSRQSARYAPGEPLLCVPTLVEWEQMLGADKVFGSVDSLMHGWFFIQLFNGVPAFFGRRLLWVIIHFVFPLILLGAILRVFVKSFNHPNTDHRGWQFWLGLMPGAARQWYGLGGLALMAVFTSILVLFLQSGTPGALSFLEGNGVAGSLKGLGGEMDPVAAGILQAGVTAKCWAVLLAIVAINTGLMLGTRMKRRLSQ